MYIADIMPLAAAAAGNTETNGTMALFSVLFSLAITVLMLAAQWRLFSKAGEAGWKILIPIYNSYILFKIIYGNGLKFLLMFVPFLNIIFAFAVYIRMAHVYGKGTGFGILNLFFTPITMCVLAFGDAEYEGPVSSFF